MGKPILVVLSGGQDSTTCLFWARHSYPDCDVHAITFNYGQRHSIELEAAARVAQMALVKSHEVVNLPGDTLVSTSPLLSSVELEQYDSYERMVEVVGDRVEATFVPMRNTLFMTIAANRAVALGAQAIVTGICQADGSNYTDCTRKYVAQMERLINVSLGLSMDDDRYIDVLTPLMDYSKAQSVMLAQQLPGCMDALAYSHTSYDGKYPPTDRNHANVLRAQGFVEANVPDPLVLRAWTEGLMDLPDTPNYDIYRGL